MRGEFDRRGPILRAPVRPRSADLAPRAPDEHEMVPARLRGASFANVSVHAGSGGGRGEGEGTRLGLFPMTAQAEPEFDEKPDCLKRFTVGTFGVTLARVNPQIVAFEAPFSLIAEFTGPCKCSALEYRQFIRGHIIRDPDGEREDRGDLLSNLPQGRLWETFQEDGEGALRYGYRSNPASTNPRIVDQYTNAKGDVDQANGCHYEMSDTPWASFRSKPGEVWDIRLDFYGEIRKQGTAIQRRYWTPIKGRFTAP